MCFFKKKPKVVIDSKYHLGELVLFRNEKRDNELFNGYIYEVKQGPEGSVLYDIQVGGECPIIYRDVPENKVVKKI